MLLWGSYISGYKSLYIEGLSEISAKQVVSYFIAWKSAAAEMTEILLFEGQTSNEVWQR